MTPGRTYNFNVVTPRDASTTLLTKLSPPPVLPPNSNFMTLTLVSGDPVEAAATLNTWLDDCPAKKDRGAYCYTHNPGGR